MENVHKEQIHYLTIHDLDWKLYLVNSDDKKLDDSCGATYKEDCEIYISNKLLSNIQLLKRTIIHEITHAFVWSYGFEDLVNRKFTEEDLCNFIETHGNMILYKTNIMIDNIESELQNE